LDRVAALPALDAAIDGSDFLDLAARAIQNSKFAGLIFHRKDASNALR
jgi:hypothetical protein